MLTCPIKALTGFDCPGCGMQRSFIALLQGNFAQSVCLYPALLPVLFTLAFTLIHIKLKFKNGPAIVKYSFLSTTAIIMISFIVKISL